MHTADVVTNCMAARQFQVLQFLRYSPDLALADFFLLPRFKRELISLSLTQETFKKECGRALVTLSAADFAMAFQRWYECCKKFVKIVGGCVEKN
jgi:hypothetical protein